MYKFFRFLLVYIYDIYIMIPYTHGVRSHNKRLLQQIFWAA
jgi:hypothetical protein